MTVEPSSWQGRLIAIALLALFFAMAWWLVIEPVRNTLVVDGDALAQDERLLLAFEERAASLSSLTAQLQDLQRQSAAQPGFLESSSTAASSTTLQNMVRHIVTQNQANLRSMQVLPARNMEDLGIEVITIRIDVALSEAVLVDFLYEFERLVPYTFLDNLTIRGTETPVAPSAATPRELAMQTDVVAYMRVAAP